MEHYQDDDNRYIQQQDMYGDDENDYDYDGQMGDQPVQNESNNALVSGALGLTYSRTCNGSSASIRRSTKESTS